MIGSETNWPRRFPAFTFAGILLALLAGGGMFRLWARFNPREAFFTRDFVKLSIYAGKERNRFLVLEPDGTTEFEYLLPVGYHQWIAKEVFGGRPLHELIQWPLAGFGGVLLVALMVGGYYDSKYNREARNGRILRGPKVIGWRQFNRETKGDGLAIEAAPGKYVRIRRDREAHHIQVAGDTGSGKSTILRSILYQVEARGDVAIVFDPDREYLSEFFDAERGDWVLNPKDARCPYWPIGEEANDEAEATPIANGLFPDGPTVQKFFLNHTRAIFAWLLAVYKPTVAEFAYWMAHPEEIDKRVKGTEHEHTLTENAAPQRAGILGSLNEAGKPLRMMPGPNEGRRVWTVKDWSETRRGWIFITSTPDTLDALRPLQSLWLDMLILKLQGDTRRPLAKDKPSVEIGFVYGNASMFRVRCYKCSREKVMTLDGPTATMMSVLLKNGWSASERYGKPIVDCNSCDKEKTRVWMILDEVAALNQLPQLHAALTRQRKSGNPIVLGFQGMSQIEFLYGEKMAQTILSQAFTNIILRTRESKAAHHLSELIGKQEIERIRENRPASFFVKIKGRSYYSEKTVTPAVMESEIQGLDDLRGYLLQLDKVVNISFKPLPKRHRAAGLIERFIPTVRAVPAVEEDEPEDTAAEPVQITVSTPVAGAVTTVADRKLKPWRGEENSRNFELFE